MKLKKVLSLCMVSALAVSLAAGCGKTDNDKKDTTAQSTTASGTSAEGTTASGSDAGGETGGTGITFPLAETANYSMFAILNQTYDLNENEAFKYACETANIKFDVQSVMGADLTEKRGLIISSGEYPDVFFKSGIGSTDLAKYGKQGIFIPLEDLIREYAPNLTKLLDERDAWKYITAADGHIYSLPEVDRPMGAMTPLWIDKKWMDSMGLTEPKSLDELYNVLKAFKEQDANGNGDANDEIALTCTDVVKPELLLPYFGVPYDQGTKTAVMNGELTYIPTSDVYKEFVAYVTKLYQEGILDKNAFTQKHEQQGAIGQSGDVLGAFFDAGAFLTVGRDNDDDYIILTPFENGIYPTNTGISEGTLVLTDTCPNPEVIIAWADQFYTEEGGILAWLGVEGKTWQKDADGNWEWIIGQGYGDDIGNVRSGHTIQGAAVHPSVQPDYWFDGMSEKIDPDEKYLNGEREKVASMGKVPLPPMTYADDDIQSIATLKADIDTYIDQYLAQVATGELDLEKSWDEYIATLDAMGATQLTEIYKKTYESALSK